MVDVVSDRQWGLYRRLLMRKDRSWTRLLATVSAVLQSNGISHWVDGGNLLALCRDGRVVPNLRDGDVDLAVIWDEETFRRTRSLREEFEALGLHFEVGNFHLTVARTLPGQWRHFAKAFRQMFPSISFGVYAPVHITLYRRHAGDLWSAWMNKASGDYLPRVFPLRFAVELTELEVAGSSFPVPHLWEQYLEYRYGTTWRIPTQDWTYYKDDGTIAPSWVGSPVFHNWPCQSTSEISVKE